MELAEVIDYEIRRIYSSFQAINSLKGCYSPLFTQCGDRGTTGQGVILYAEIKFEDSGMRALNEDTY